MRLKRITAVGLKNRNIDITLAPLTVIVGPNGVGKSAIREAITLATNGYIPAIGDKEYLTMQIASDKSMSVTAELDNGHKTTQTWQHASPKYSGQPVVANPKTMADIGVFFAMTGPQRAAHVFSLSDPAELGATDQKVIKALAGITINSQPEADFKAQLIEETKLFIHEAKPKSVNVWMQEMVRDISEQFTMADKDVKGLEKAQSAKASKTDGALFSESIPDDVESQLKDARVKLDELKRENNKAETVEDSCCNILNKIETAQRAAQVVIPEGDPDAIEKEIKALAAKKESITVSKGLGIIYGDACAALSAAKGITKSAAITLQNAEKELADFKEDCVCSECKRVYPPEMVKVAKRRLSDAVKKAKASLTEAEAKEAIRAKEHSEASAADLANTARMDERVKIDAQMRQLDDKRQSILTARAKAKSSTAFYGDESELQKQLAEAEAKIEALKPQIAEAQAKVESLEQMNQKRIERAQDAKRAQEDQQALWAAKTCQTILKGAKKAIQEVYEEMNSSCWQRLVKTARRVTDGLKSEGIDLVLDFDGTDLIYWKGGQKVTVDAMSGAQRLMAHTGLQIALNEHAPLRLVMCDSLSGDLDDKHCLHFLNRVNQLIGDGLVDGFVCFDWNGPRYHNIKMALKLTSDQFSIVEVA